VKILPFLSFNITKSIEIQIMLKVCREFLENPLIHQTKDDILNNHDVLGHEGSQGDHPHNHDVLGHEGSQGTTHI
jgi:hypothetical protein